MRLLRNGAFRLCASWLFLGPSGCALLSKADVVDVRYFSPERQRQESVDAGMTARPVSRARELRLGRVSSGANLRERIVHRDAAYELGYYDDLRWTERPEVYVRRALGRTLFEEHGLHRALTGDAPTLDIELIAFDDVRLPTGRAARVQLRLILYTQASVLFEDTVTVDRIVNAGKTAIEDLVAAMAAAMDMTAEQAAVKVESAMDRERL